MNFDLLSLLKQLVYVDDIDIADSELEAGFNQTKNPGGESNLIYKVINQIILRSKNPSIGLSVGKLINPNSFHGLGYLFMSAENLKQACSRITEFPNFFHNIVSIKAGDIESQFCFSVENQAKQSIVNAVINEATLGIIYQYTNWLSQRKISVSQILLESEPMSSEETYIKHFGQYPTFGAHQNSIIFEMEEALTPLISSQPEYHAALYSKLHEKHESLSDTFVSKAKKAIRKRIGLGEYSRRTIASDLNISEKTFERRLSQYKLSYQELIDGIRLEIAQRYLNIPGYSIESIAGMLGFSDRSTFSKAYKKWTGYSPREKAALFDKIKNQ